MPTYVKVCINGFVLSTLLFDCANNNGDQEGFLYGSITRNVRREISDQSMSNTQEDILISICSSVPCGSFLSFYNNVGEINREELAYNLGDRVENIVGWYRYRRYSAMYPSAREQVVHRKLRALFANSSCVDDSYFVFGLLSSSNLPNFATHSFDYAFFTQRVDDTFKNLNLTILNLGDTRNSYRSGSLALPFMNSSSFHSVLSSSWNFNTFYETEDQIQQFHQRLRLKLESLQEELAASDAVNATLEEDIRRLSNEMQTLLATQERLTSAARGTQISNERVEEIAEQKSKECANSKDELLASKEKLSKDSESNKSVLTEPCKSTGKKEQSKVGEPGRESPRLKRSAITLLDNRSSKRACPDKYFESADYQDGSLDAKSLEQSTVSSAPEITSSKQEDNVLGSSQMLVVDPDSGEMSTAHSEVDNTKSEVTSCQLQDNLIPSPASTVEIVISGVEIHRLAAQPSAILREFALLCLTSLMIYGFLSSYAGEDISEESGSSTSEELSDMKESPELSDVKESNSESAISPKEVVTSGPSSLSCKTVDSEHQSEISSTTQDLSHKMAFNENILSGSSTSKASSSDDPPCKLNRPYIIYASKEPDDSSVNQAPSCSEQSSEVDESQLKESSDEKSDIKSGLSSSSDQSESEKKGKI